MEVILLMGTLLLGIILIIALKNQNSVMGRDVQTKINALETQVTNRADEILNIRPATETID